MNTHTDKNGENKSMAAANSSAQLQKNNTAAIRYEDNRPQAVAQRKMQDAINNSPRVQQLKAIRENTNNSILEKGVSAEAMVEENTVQERSEPVQLARAKRKTFRGGKTKYASRHNGNIGSVYAQKAGSRYNRGHRIRLEHGSGPHVSKKSSYRHQLDAGVQTLLPNADIGGPGAGTLVESRIRGGSISHTSRGAIGDMAPLTDAQSNALFNLAAASDADRANIGAGLTYADKPAHAAVHNQNIRELLRTPLFAAHELGTQQLVRDAVAGAPNP